MKERPSIKILKQQQQDNLFNQMLSLKNALVDAKGEVKQLEAKLEIVEDEYEDVKKLINELEGETK